MFRLALRPFRAMPVRWAARGFRTKVPTAIVVNVEVDPARLDEFLTVIELDAVGSRMEPDGGCVRFDVLRDQSADNKFVFYEVYRDAEAVAVHRSTPHFQAWTDFKASGGVLSQSVVKADAIMFSDGDLVDADSIFTDFEENEEFRMLEDQNGRHAPQA
jgi:quinol monooxygenase YgiN